MKYGAYNMLHITCSKIMAFIGLFNANGHQKRTLLAMLIARLIRYYSIDEYI